MIDLKFGDVVSWSLEGAVIRWMLISPLPGGVQWRAAWAVSPEEDDGVRWELGQIKVIGVSETTVVVSG
jgi:hypothetical protein